VVLEDETSRVEVSRVVVGPGEPGAQASRPGG
jgi:hypothetical protein